MVFYYLNYHTDQKHDYRDPWDKESNKNDNFIKNNRNKCRFNYLCLNDFFYNLFRKFSFFGNNRNGTTNVPRKDNYYYFGVVLFLILLFWVCSGFYTIKEAERGVVLRFGKFNRLVYPGLNWKPTFLDVIIPVNVESVRELAASGMMLTSDENVVRVEMNVQYRVTEPERYLFSVINADDSLRQATDSALRGVIGKYTMDRILTEGRTLVRSDTRRVLESTIYPYNMGITLLDVNFQTARPPEEVKASFDDAIAARENEQQYIREAEAYANEVQPRANGQAQRILEEGKAYKARTVFKAQGEVERFLKILPEYKIAPKITRERLYIDSMERILRNTSKILVNDQLMNNFIIFPIERFFDSSVRNSNKVDSDRNGYSFLRSKDFAVNQKTSSGINTSAVNRSKDDLIIKKDLNKKSVDNSNRVRVSQRDNIIRESRG